MAVLAVLSLLLGAMLGRYKVLVLVPTIIVGAALAIAVGIARADDVWLIGLTVTLVSVCLQFGYLCGAVIVSLMVHSRATRIRDRKFMFKQALSR